MAEARPHSAWSSGQHPLGLTRFAHDRVRTDALGTEQYDLRAPNVFLGTVSIRRNRLNAFAIRAIQVDRDSCAHGADSHLQAENGILRDAPSAVRKPGSVRLFASFIAAATTAWLAICAPAPAGESGLPAEVTRFLSRRSGCHEWSQMENDPSQAAQIDKIVRALKCEDIKGDEQAFRNSYADNPRVIAALNATWVKAVKRIPAQTHPGTLPSDLDH